MKISTTIDYLVKTHDFRNSVHLFSAPGIGKSSLVDGVSPAGYCARLAMERGDYVGLITIMGTNIDAPDAAGALYLADDPFGVVDTKIMRASLAPTIPHPTHFQKCGGMYHVYGPDGQRVESFKGVPDLGVVFLDEYMQSDADVRKPLADLKLNHRTRSGVLPDGWRVVCASNRTEDRSGTGRAMMHDVNRETHIFVENNPEEFSRFGIETGLHPLAIAFARWRPDLVFTGAVPDKDGQFCTPRSLVRGVNGLMQLGDGVNIPFDHPAAQEAIQGDVGEGVGIEFLAFAKMADQLPTYSDIVKSPTKTVVPDRPDACAAICAMIASRMSMKDCDAVFQYIERLPKEYQTALVQDVVMRDPNAVSTKRFGKWIENNLDLASAVLS